MQLCNMKTAVTCYLTVLVVCAVSVACCVFRAHCHIGLKENLANTSVGFIKAKIIYVAALREKLLFYRCLHFSTQ